MLCDCMEVFEQELSLNGERWLLDQYIPKEGSYLLINLDREFEIEGHVDIAYNRKTEELEGKTHQDFRLIQFLDYNSKLLEMNKPIDPKKVIHSNNIYSFFVKKESLTEKKVTQEVLDGYYGIISSPGLKYAKSKKSASLYQKAEQELGRVDVDTAEKIKAWLEAWLMNPTLPDDIDMSKKNYLKLFFIYNDREKTRKLFERENRRYLIPNIYNNNDFNEEINGVMAGLPGNNMGMNSKKPFLANRSRKREVPCIISIDRALLQGKFFDFLWGKASTGKTDIYFDYDKKKIHEYDSGKTATDPISCGGYLHIRKDKNEARIEYMDTLTDYQPGLVPEFYYKNIMDLKPKFLEEIEEGYGGKGTKNDLNRLFDEVFFGKKLLYNYFTEPSDITFRDKPLENILLTYRGRLFEWFYKGMDGGIQPVVQEMAMKLIYHSVSNGYWNKIKHQMNLMWSLTDYFEQNNHMEECVKMLKQSLKKHMDMYKEEWDFDNDEEYYYAVGQMVSGFLSLSRAKNTPLSIINSFINASEDKRIKEKLIQMFQKYNYNIDSKRDVRIKNLLAHILMYEPVGKVQKDKLTAGLVDVRLIYETKDGKKNPDNEELEVQEK